MASDKLSNLPKEVVDEILMFLPIRDAVKTCVLSSSWKNRWAYMPELVFDTRSILSSIRGEHGRTNLVKFVDRSLMLHDGMISKFKFDQFLDRGCSDVDQWILFLSRKKTLNHLALLFKNTTNKYQIPSCLFACQTLRKLELGSCILSLPSQYKGFGNIIYLRLYNVTITNETFELLVNKIPLLRTLNVMFCNSLTRCNINAPNLQSVCIAGSFESINFQNAAKVTSAGFRLKLPGLSEALGGLDRLVAVGIVYPLLECLQADIEPVKLKITCYHLRAIKIYVNFEDSKQILAVLCLCRSSPCLQTFKIEAHWDRKSAVLHEENFWEARLRLRKEDDDALFKHLKTVTLSGFKGAKNDIGFTQFILLNALWLKTFCIFPEETAFMEEKPHLVEEMMQFQRASTIAKVVFKNKVNN